MCQIKDDQRTAVVALKAHKVDILHVVHPRSIRCVDALGCRI